MRFYRPSTVVLSLLAPAAMLAGCPALSPVITIEPDRPTTVDDLIVTLDPTDPGATYQWSRDGITQAELTNDSVPAELTAKGERWTVAVAIGGDPVGSADISIANAAPSATVSLPPKGTTGRDLVATVEAEDPDGDTVTYQVSWTVDGNPVAGSEPTLPATVDMPRDSTVEITLTPTDGENAGETVTASTVMGNGIPSITGATISPAVPVEADIVTCAGLGWSDPDGDAEGYQTRWQVNGADVSTDAELTGAAFDKGDEIVCILTPWDGSIGGDPVTSEPVVVGNTPPVAESITFDPVEPVMGDRVSATLHGIADVDGDQVSVDWVWERDGVPLVLDGERLQIRQSLAHAKVTVRATPTDGEDPGSPVVERFTVANTPPVIELRSLDVIPRHGTKPAIDVVAFDDADDDPVTVTYEWTVNGSVVDDGVKCDACNLKKGDSLVVTGTADDGFGGTATHALTVTVANTEPTGGVVEVDSGTGKLGSDVVCDLVSPSTDVDGDSLTYTVEFYVNSAAWTGTTTTTSLTDDTIPSEEIRLDDRIQCRVSVSDGTDTVGPLTDSVILSTCASLPTTYPTGSKPPVALREQGGFCYYLGSKGGTCDQACGYIGGGNWAADAASALGSGCRGPAAGSPTRHFLTYDNKGGWKIAGTSRLSLKTLGHGHYEGYAWGACSTGTTKIGTWPGESNSDSGRSLVCACF